VVHTATTRPLRCKAVNIFAENGNIQHKIYVRYHDKNRQAHLATHDSLILSKTSFLSQKRLSKIERNFTENLRCHVPRSSVTACIIQLRIHSSADAAAFSHFLFIFVLCFFALLIGGMHISTQNKSLQFFAGIHSDKSDSLVTRVFHSQKYYFS
jgi:hypothetical protein